MTYEDFESLIESYGSKPENWPETSRKAMEIFAQDNQEAVAPILAAAAELDAKLDRVVLNPGTDMLKARIMNQIGETPQSASVTPEVSTPRKGVGYGMVAALMVGAFTLGVVGTSLMPTAQGESEIYAQAETEMWQEAATGYGMTDVYSWVNDSEG